MSSSSVIATPLDRDSYSATTLEELEAIKAAREAEEARIIEAAAAEERAKNSKTTSYDSAPLAKMNGIFAWPLTTYTVYDWEQNGFQTSERPDHNGLDMLAPAGTPIYAAHDGTVTVSSESYGAYGVGIVISGPIDGQELNTTYGHMTYGTRAVEVGATVKAGQLIGRVGSTGRSTANHLHFEVRINGNLVDPNAWLTTNLS